MEKIDAVDKCAIVLPEHVDIAPCHSLQDLTAAATGTLAGRRQCSPVANHVTHQWHGVVVQVRDDDIALCTGGHRMPLLIHNLDVISKGKDVQTRMFVAFAGNIADLA